jgi:predicted nuclease of restriction endonuclease-like (RecB) superfamily
MNSDTMKPTLLGGIKQVLEKARNQVQQTVHSAMVQAYWQIGKLIVEDEQKGKRRAAYGKAVLKSLSEQLTKEYGKGFDITNLRNMRRFYLKFPIRDSVRPELSWTHYRTLLKVENKEARLWYMEEAQQQTWSVRALERQIGTLYYERLLASKSKTAVKQEAQENTHPLDEKPQDFLRDPYILDFLNLNSGHYQEADLEQGIINNLQKFLLELGRGFAFVERQQRIATEDGDYFIDLVFYNFHLKCFVLIDLKLNKLNHQDVGQMDMYVRMYEEQKRNQGDNPTIGLILCSEHNHTVAKYSVLHENQQLFASKYVTHLPSEEELQQELERERVRIERGLKN